MTPHEITRLRQHNDTHLAMLERVLIADDEIGKRCREKMVNAWKTLDRVNADAIRKAIEELEQNGAAKNG